MCSDSGRRRFVGSGAKGSLERIIMGGDSGFRCGTGYLTEASGIYMHLHLATVCHFLLPHGIG